MAISTNGGSNPTSVLYNGKNCTEVWYKSSPSAEAVKVWPDDKYYLLLRYTPGTASRWQDDKYKIVRQSPGGLPWRGGRLVTWRNVPDGNSNWHELLLEYDAPQGDMTFYPGDVYGNKYTKDFIQWGDGVTEDTIIRTMDAQYNTQSNPLVITAYFKGGVSPGPEPPIPTGKAYLTQNHWPKVYSSGSKSNMIDHDPHWKQIKVISEENPNSRYYEQPKTLPFTCKFFPVVSLSDYPLQYWTLQKPDGTVLRFDDLDAHDIVIDQPGEWKENSYWSEPPKPAEFTITSITDGYVTVKPSASIKAKEGSTKQVMYQISSSSGRIFDSIYIDGVKQSTPKGLSAMYTFTNITSDRTINVTTKVKPQTTYTIQANSDSYSSISPSGSVTVNEGATQKFTMKVTQSNRQISSVYVDGTNVGKVSTYTFSNVNADHKITVYTEEKPAQLVFNNYKTSDAPKLYLFEKSTDAEPIKTYTPNITTQFPFKLTKDLKISFGGMCMVNKVEVWFNEGSDMWEMPKNYFTRPGNISLNTKDLWISLEHDDGGWYITGGNAGKAYLYGKVKEWMDDKTLSSGKVKWNKVYVYYGTDFFSGSSGSNTLSIMIF